MTLLAVHPKFFLTSWVTFSFATDQICHILYALKCPCVKLARGLELTSLKLRLTVPGVFLQALFLVDDDVLNVLHSQVVTEGVEQDVFQLLQGDPLHVELQEDTDEGRIFLKTDNSFTVSWQKDNKKLSYNLRKEGFQASTKQIGQNHTTTLKAVHTPSIFAAKNLQINFNMLSYINHSVCSSHFYHVTL